MQGSSKFHANFLQLLNLKQDHPAMGLSMTAITQHIDLLPKPEFSYKGLWGRIQLSASKFMNTTRFSGNTEQVYRDMVLDVINGKAWSWALVMPLDEQTNLKNFSKIYLFAHDVLKHTLPVVCMTPGMWGNMQEKVNTETYTRLDSNVYEATETDTLMLRSTWCIANERYGHN